MGQAKKGGTRRKPVKKVKQRGTKEERISQAKSKLSMRILEKTNPRYEEWLNIGAGHGLNFKFMTIISRNNVDIGCAYVDIFAKDGEYQTRSASIFEEEYQADAVDGKIAPMTIAKLANKIAVDSFIKNSRVVFLQSNT